MAITILAALACAGPSAHAAPRGADSSTVATSIPTALHLEDALALALGANWDLLAARSELEVAQAGERTASAWPNPSASVSTTRIHVDGSSDATTLGDTFWKRAYDSIGQLGELVEIGGKRSARRRAARATTAAARARLADTRRGVAASTVHAYAAAALAEASAHIAGQSAAYLRDEARIAAIRLQAGDISSSDRDQIELAADRLELDAGAALASARAQRLALEIMLGIPRPTGDVALADSLEWLADRAQAAPVEPARGERADLVAARSDLARSAGELQLQRALRIPDPTLTIQAEHAPPDRPNSVGAGVAVTLPFFDRNAGAIAAAQASRQAAARDVARVAAQIASDIASARASFTEADERWRRYRDELRPRSEAVRRAVSLAYEKGGASLLDLLQAQRNDNDVRLDAMRAASDATVAAADLAAATSTYTPENTRP